MNDFSYIDDILDEDALDLEVIETGWYIEKDDPSHLNYCAIVGTCKLPEDAEENSAYTLECKADCLDFTDESYLDPQCRTTDFSIFDVSEEEDDAYHVTGEIANDYDDDVASVTIVMIMRMDGDIVFADKDTIYNLKWDETKSFDFRYKKEIPEHDEIEFYVTAT